MKIKHSTWWRFCRIIGYLFFPFGVLDFIRPSWWSETDWNISIGVFFIVGFAGALVAILVRTGKIEFVYSEKDKKKNHIRCPSLSRDKNVKILLLKICILKNITKALMIRNLANQTTKALPINDLFSPRQTR
jgi:hypothetical protein